MTEAWRVFVVNERDDARRELRELMSQAAEVEVVGDAAPGVEGYEEALAARPDVLVGDVGKSEQAVQLCRELLSRLPHTKCIIVATFNTEEGLLQALLVGALDYLQRGASREDIVDVMRAIHSGDEPPLSAKLAERVAQDQAGSEELRVLLTDQQFAVVKLVARGLTNREIAERMHLSEHTVRNYLSKALHRLGMRNRTEVAAHLARLAAAERHPWPS